MPFCSSYTVCRMESMDLVCPLAAAYFLLVCNVVLVLMARTEIFNLGIAGVHFLQVI